MTKRIIYTCDRCMMECLGVTNVDTGNDYSEGRVDGAKVRVNVELCSTCLLALREWMKPKTQEGKAAKE